MVQMTEDVGSLTPMGTSEQELRVAATTDSKQLATSIVRNMEEGKRVVLSCIGVPTVNLAARAVAIANGQTAPRGYVVLMLPAFHVTNFRDRDTNEPVERTSIRFSILKHRIG